MEKGKLSTNLVGTMELRKHTTATIYSHTSSFIYVIIIKGDYYIIKIYVRGCGDVTSSMTVSDMTHGQGPDVTE